MNRLFLLSSLFLILGCQVWQNVEVLRVDGFSDLSISLEGMSGEVEVVVKNPNGFNINAFEADVDVFIGAEQIGTITLPRDQVLVAGSESRLVMDIQSNPGALKNILQKQLLQVIGGASIELRASGSVTGKAFGLRVVIPVESSEQINL